MSGLYSPGAFRALRHRNFRLFFIGQGISLVGTWMQIIAQSWLVYRLSGSVALLGTIGFASRLPSLLSPFTGVLADRFDRYRLMLVTQALSMAQAVALAWLVLDGRIQVWHVFVLGTGLGLINAFDIPVRQSAVTAMIDDPQDLPNAIALNSTMFNGARLLGPALAGALVAWLGEGWCFGLNALSFVAVIISLSLMRLPKLEPDPQRRGSLHAFREGWAYVSGRLPLSRLLLLLSVTSLAGMSYQVLMPVFAKDVLHGGAQTQGQLISAVGLGSLVGALLMAHRKGLDGLGRQVAFGSVAFGLCLAAFSLSHSFWLSWGLLAVMGFFMMLQMTGNNTLLQSLAEERLRGRVMGFQALAFMGTMPFGNLLAGALAARFGPQATLVGGGLVCSAAGVVFWLGLPRFHAEADPVLERHAAQARPEGGPLRAAEATL